MVESYVHPKKGVKGWMAGEANGRFGKRGKEDPCYGRKRPEHSKVMKGNQYSKGHTAERTEEHKNNYRNSWTPERREAQAERMRKS